MEDMQALAITSLSAADVAKQYEHIRELGKGTYGKVDLVAHRTQGESVKAPKAPLIPRLLDMTRHHRVTHLHNLCLH